MDKRSLLKNKQLKRFKLHLNYNGKTKNFGSKKLKNKKRKSSREEEYNIDESPVMSDSNLDSSEFKHREKEKRNDREEEELNVDKINLKRFEMLLRKANPETECENDSINNEESFNNLSHEKTRGIPFENHGNIETIHREKIQKKFFNSEKMYEIDLKAERIENEKLTQENQRLIGIIKNCMREKEDLNKELAKKHKEIIKSKNKCDSISSEFMQVMSERDIVHKEIEALQEKIAKYEEEKMKNESLENKVKFYQNKFLNNPNPNMKSTLLNEKFDSLEMLEALRQQLNFVSKQRDDALSQVHQLTRNSMKNLSDNGFEQELNRDLPFQNESQTKRISILLKEIDILKKKRDWIFNERDKVLKERESIRGLCDDLRHQRDKAISELAEALRQVDEIQKQNSSAYQQIYKLEDKITLYEEKLSYYREMTEREKSSYRDDQDEKPERQETSVTNENDLTGSIYRMLKIEIEMEKNDELGLEFSYLIPINSQDNLNSKEAMNKISNLSREVSSEDNREITSPSSQNINKDNGTVIISKIEDDSVAFGKLKVNDQVLVINGHKLKSAESLENILSNLKDSTITFIVSRSFGRKKEKCSTEAVNASDELSYLTHSNRSIGTFSEISQKNMSNTNEKSMNSSYSELKSSAKKNINILNKNQNKISSSYTVSLCVNSFSKLLLETGVYVAALKKAEGMMCRASKCFNEKPCNASLCKAGDRVMSINGISLRNKPIHDIFELFKNCQYFDLVMQKENSLFDNQSFSSNNFIDSARSQTESLVESENRSFSKSFNQPHSGRNHSKISPHLFDSNESMKFFDSKGNLIPISRENNKIHNINSKTKQYNFQSNPKAVKPLNESHFYSNDDLKK